MDDGRLEKCWLVMFEVDEFDVFVVAGGICGEFTIVRDEDMACYMMYGMALRVRGEELAERIWGVGIA